jgi:hypothetical protein
MKKLLLSLVCCLILLSCQIPESLTVKGNPGLYVPLGSPFAAMKEEDRLENLISSKKIMEMMNSKTSETDTDNELLVYEVSENMARNHGFDTKLQTYMVQYPLTEMPLNLEEYLNNSMSDVNEKGEISIPEIPALTGSLPANTYYYIYGDGSSDMIGNDNKPFFKVPLNDMAKLVEKVTRNSGGKFGMEINYTSQLAQYLEIKIPAFGINYKKGTPYPAVNPTKLIYADDSGNDFVPRDDLHKSGDDSELWVYARISGPCVGNIEPGMVFEWTKALIDTSSAGAENGAFHVEYPIENSLGDFLGGGVSFKKVDGYVYMSGIVSPKPIIMTVDIGNGSTQTRNLQEAKESFTTTTKPDGTNVVDGSLTTSSFINGTPLDLAPIFETEGATLKVDINIQDMEIENDDNIANKSIKFNLYVLIPMNLKVSEVPGKEALPTNVGGVNIKNNYVQLDLGDALDKIGKGDLFGREEGKDNLLKDIDSVELILKGVEISIIKQENLMLLVKTNNNYKLLEFKENASLMFDGSSLGVPFSPEFFVLLKKDVISGSSGSFEILRTVAPKFDFKIDVKAKAKIDYTIEF